MMIFTRFLKYTSLILLISFSIGQTSEKFLTKRSEYTYVGTLETRSAGWPEETFKDSTHKRIVRVMFCKTERDWISLHEKIGDSTLYPSNCQWTIAFDNQNLGKFNTTFPTDLWSGHKWYYPRNAHHIPKTINLPMIGKPTAEFSGWGPEVSYARPLIVVSKANYTDPELWKPFNPGEDDIDYLIPHFKSYIEKITDKKQITTPEICQMKSYRSKHGKTLIKIGLLYKENNSDVEYISDAVWFWKSVEGNVRNLSEEIDKEFSNNDFTDDDQSSISLVDAGDYDADGNSEIIFWTSRYNSDGYVMFYNNCKSAVHFCWSYH